MTRHAFFVCVDANARDPALLALATLAEHNRDRFDYFLFHNEPIDEPEARALMDHYQIRQMAYGKESEGWFTASHRYPHETFTRWEAFGTLARLGYDTAAMTDPDVLALRPFPDAFFPGEDDLLSACCGSLAGRFSQTHAHEHRDEVLAFLSERVGLSEEQIASRQGISCGLVCVNLKRFTELQIYPQMAELFASAPDGRHSTFFFVDQGLISLLIASQELPVHALPDRFSYSVSSLHHQFHCEQAVAKPVTLHATFWPKPWEPIDVSASIAGHPNAAALLTVRRWWWEAAAGVLERWPLAAIPMDNQLPTRSIHRLALGFVMQRLKASQADDRQRIGRQLRWLLRSDVRRVPSSK